MTDEVLDDLRQRHQRRRDSERSFTILGETLTVKPAVAPQVAIDYYAAKRRLIESNAQARVARENDEEPPEIPEDLRDPALIELMDATARACLDASTVPAWERLRSPDSPDPLDWDDLFDLCEFLIGRASAHPTDEPSGSSNGLSPTESSSEAASPSPVSTPTA